MAQKKMTYGLVAIICICCIVYLVTTLIAVNCAADKNMQCAQASGLTAGVFGCILLSGIVAAVMSSKGGGGMG